MLRRTTLLLIMVLAVSVTALAADNNLVQSKFLPADDPSAPPPGWIYFTAASGDYLYLEEQPDGSYVLVIETKGERNAGLRSEPLPAKPGEFYIARVEVNAEPGNRAALYLDFWDAQRTRILHSSVYTENPGTWEVLEAALLAPEGTEYVSIILYSTASMAPGKVRWRNPELFME